MENLCDESDLGRFERVVCGELDAEVEFAALINAVFGAIKCGIPMEQVVTGRPSADVAHRHGFLLQVLEFSGDSLLSR